MSDLTTKVLIEIRDEIKTTRTELSARLDVHEKVLVRLVDLAERHEHVLVKLVDSVDSLNGRFDNFLTGAHQKAHEEERLKYDALDARITRLEQRERAP